MKTKKKLIIPQKKFTVTNKKFIIVFNLQKGKESAKKWFFQQFFTYT